MNRIITTRMIIPDSILYETWLTWFVFFLRNVFLGLACDRLNRNHDAENAYYAASGINPNDRTAWQGLVSLYEKQGGCDHGGYHKAVIALGKIFAEKYVLIPL